MSTEELLTELNESFQNVPYPGDADIVTNNAPDYDLESLGIREAFKKYSWQTLPTDLLAYEQDSYELLSKAGFKYYLPAYLRFAIQQYAEADSIPDNLIFSLTLPAEIDVVTSALDIKQYQMDEHMPAIDWNKMHQTQLQGLNPSVHRFIDRHSQFDSAQSRSIYHFLIHMRDEHGKDYWNNEPDIAIQRYWFQFK